MNDTSVLIFICVTYKKYENMISYNSIEILSANNFTNYDSFYSHHKKNKILWN